MAAAKARGVRLGNSNGAAALRRRWPGAATVGVGDRFAADLAPVIADIRAGGATALRAAATAIVAIQYSVKPVTQDHSIAA